MSAVLRHDEEATSLRPIVLAQLDAVLDIEVAVYPFPWSRGNFIDSLVAGYWMRGLHAADGALIGYVVAMRGFEEMHLLNITVAPAQQSRGHARVMLAELLDQGRREDARKLWLEVRVSNTRARALYERLGFQCVGLRKGYYPAALERREDALVMSLAIDEAGRGLD